MSQMYLLSALYSQLYICVSVTGISNERTLDCISSLQIRSYFEYNELTRNNAVID